MNQYQRIEWVGKIKQILRWYKTIFIVQENLPM